MFYTTISHPKVVVVIVFKIDDGIDVTDVEI